MYLHIAKTSGKSCFNKKGVALNQKKLFNIEEVGKKKSKKKLNDSITVPQRNQVFAGNKCKEVLDGNATIF